MTHVAVADWVREVRRWIGVPVVHQGTDRVGVDCSGLIIGAAATFGVAIERGFLNGRMPSGEDVTQAMERYARRIRRLDVGAIVQHNVGREPRHLGVYVGDNACGQPLMVHAKGRRRRVVETLLPADLYAVWWPDFLEAANG